MEYGRLEPSHSARFTEQIPVQDVNKNSIEKRYTVVIILVLILALFATVLVFVAIKHQHKQQPSLRSQPLPSGNTDSITGSEEGQETTLLMLPRMCQMTQFPDVCLTSLGEGMKVKEGGNDSEYEKDLQGEIMQVSLDVTLNRLGDVLHYLSSEKKTLDPKDSLQLAAHDDCILLMEDSVDMLNRSRSHVLILSSPASNSYDDKNHTSLKLDLVTWMTTLCTNQDTCMEGFEEAGGTEKADTAQMLQGLFQIVSNHVILSDMVLNKGTYNPVSGRRLLSPNSTNIDPSNPEWLSGKNEALLNTTMAELQANLTVSQDGIGPNITVKTITEAIELAPNNSNIPFVIHIKAGRYQESNLAVVKHKTNLWFVGDGKGLTIITGNQSSHSTNTTTMKTATFGAFGNGFMARGITFENTAGAKNHQAVALLVKSDCAVFYECEMKGYQDTLYVHSNRQFFRECNIYGTVDFIFGNAQVVFQNSSIYARRPLEHQNNTITAQKQSSCACLSTGSRPSGISIHESNILADSDLEPVKSNYSTYLGRPWREFATVVYMLSWIGDHIDPQGWIPWNATISLDNVYYGEFLNYGPGANTSQRVKSPGIHVNLSIFEATQFTVSQFVGGSAWITPTNVPFESGLGNLD